MSALIKKFISDDSGATAIEYGLIATFIGIALIGTLTAMGPALDAVFLFILASL